MSLAAAAKNIRSLARNDQGGRPDGVQVILHKGHAFIGHMFSKSEDQKVLEQVLPRVVDNFQVYLRELRAEDLRGSAGLYRLREDLLSRAQTAAAPADVRDVLFKEMLIQ